ncbi:Carbon-nitrogen hydrolase, partial [Tulasnella sp. 427]
DVQVAGNAAALFGPEGELVGTYRKTNLYKADLPWAQAGTGFTTFELPPPLKKLAIGICMDLSPNPASYEALENGKNADVVREPYELAEFCIEQKVDTLVIPCTQYCGSSTVMQLEQGIGKPNLVGVLKKDEDGYRIFTLDV